MTVKYYNDAELAYANRKRYKTFSFASFYQEEQNAILLGNGAKTSIKTSVNNICNYVTIDNTKWYVTSYEYLNGGQVRLNLQRDVVGEFGLSGSFGNIERGYTDNILKFRKELGLNQQLKKRIPLKSTNNNYGNFNVDNHEKEKWGVIYLSKPANSEDKLSINIPEFAPEYIEKSDIPDINTGTRYLYVDSYKSYISFTIGISADALPESVLFTFNIVISFDKDTASYSISEILNHEKANIIISLCQSKEFDAFSMISFKNDIIKDIAEKISLNILNLFSSHYTLPNKQTLTNPAIKYNGSIVKEENKFYRYNVERKTKSVYGKTCSGLYSAQNLKFSVINELFYSQAIKVGSIDLDVFRIIDYYPYIYSSSETVYVIDYVTKTELNNTEAGIIDISYSKDYINEPFYVLICPLYDVKISGAKSFNIERNSAFNVFNLVIQYLSGENSYLVDAQIYPYCPLLKSVGAALKINNSDEEYPFFVPSSTSFDTYCDVQLLPYKDIKKEYIKRQYSIVSPDQSNKFTFNFYDYETDIEENLDISDNLNYKNLTICIKTALKPFSIISSAVLQSKSNSIKGITYESDLRGCNSSSGGFEVSLATDKFQEYVRQNSNYKQFFELQQEELQKQHSVERVNEKISGIVNTVTATAMGAIGGASAGTGPLSKSIAAGVGGAGAGLAVGGAMVAQYKANEELREYEETLQKQKFDLEIGTIKNLPTSVTRVSSFNEIIMRDFNYIIETYECTEAESLIVDNFIENYSYGIGVFDLFQNYYKNGWFLRGNVVKSNLITNLHLILSNELRGGIYLYE